MEQCNIFMVEMPYASRTLHCIYNKRIEIFEFECIEPINKDSNLLFPTQVDILGFKNLF